MRSSVAAATACGQLDADLDAGVAALACKLAAALDRLDPVKDAYGFARVGRVLLQVLEAARLTPPSRMGLGDEVQKWLADLAVPTPPDPS